MEAAVKTPVAQSGEVGKDLVWVRECPWLPRQYIDTARSVAEKWAFKSDFVAPVGSIHFSEEEKTFAREFRAKRGSFYVIEPNVKGSFSGSNKAWPFANWQEFMDLEGVYGNQHPFLQLGPSQHSRQLSGVPFVHTKEGFRQALCILEASDGFLGTDGGLHHAAAALGKPAVVLWGHYTSPKNLGYSSHVNIWHEPEGSPCGTLGACEECDRAMANISVGELQHGFEVMRERRIAAAS